MLINTISSLPALACLKGDYLCEKIVSNLLDLCYVLTSICVYLFFWQERFSSKRIFLMEEVLYYINSPQAIYDVLTSNSLARVWRLQVPNDTIEQYLLLLFFKKYYLVLLVLFMEFDSWSDHWLTFNYRFVHHDKTTSQVVCRVLPFASQFV